MNRPINPFVAIFLIVGIGILGTAFVIHEINETDFASASYQEAGLN